MKRTRISILAGILLAALQTHAQVSITTGGTYDESFDGLATAGGVWADNSTLPGWYAASTNVGASTFSPFTAITATAGGGSSSTTLYAIRQSSSSTDYALGAVPSATGGRTLLGWRFVNGDSVVITNLVLLYDGEQWSRGTTINSSVTVSYRIFDAGTGSLEDLDGWTDAPASLTFVPLVAGAAGAINGNDDANRSPGLAASITDVHLLPNQEIWFRWYFIKVGGGSFMMGLDNARLEVPTGTAPVISPIENMSVKVLQTSVTNAFTVTDAEDDATGTPLGGLTASSSNEDVLPTANIFFEGTGMNRAVYVIAGGTAGNADVTVSVQDSHGNIGRNTFTVEVRPANTAPVIGDIRWTNTLQNVAVTIPFTVSDEESPAAELNVTGTIADYSSGILSSLQFGTDASGANRTVTVTPVPGATGVGIVNLSLEDSELTDTASLAIMVCPDGNTVFIDHFDYPVDQDILLNSPGFWLRRNGSAQTQKFETVVDSTKALIKPVGSAEDAAAPLAFGPYAPGSGVVLFTMMKAQWVDLGDTPADSTGAFVVLANNAGASADQFMQLGTAPGDGGYGFFKLKLSNGENIYTTRPTDLGFDSVYDIVVRYDVDTAKATAWVNATSETDPGTSATDNQNPASAAYICIRQEPGMGYIYLDELQVVAIRKPDITSITPPSSGNVEIFFTAGAGDAVGDFEVERASSLTSAFQSTSETITALGEGNFKAVVPASGDQNFYRVKRAPFVF